VKTNVTLASQADGLFGAGSCAADMVRAFIAANPYVPLDVWAVADASGSTKAVWTITLSGAPLQAATAICRIDGVAVQFAVGPALSASAMAANLQAALAAMPDLPAVATVSGAVVTLTANHGGTVGNGIDIRLNNYVASERIPGLVATIAQTTTGSGDPDITVPFAALATVWYTDIVFPWTGSTTLAAVATEAARRYNAMAKLDSHFYTAMKGSYGTVSATAVNSQFLTILPYSQGLSAPWQWAASLAGVCSYQLMNDPARQLRGQPLPGIVGPTRENLYLETQQNLLLGNSGTCRFATFDLAPGGTVILQRVTTTYYATPLGVIDDSWMDIMTPKVMTRIRYDWNSYVTQVYPNAKLADDGSLAAEYAAGVVTPKTMAGSWAARAKLYETLGWIINTSVTSKQATFVRNATDRNRLDATLPVQIIGNLMVLADIMGFEF
jgi:phage tail sheath gpL-like